MTSPRPYQALLSPAAALAQLTAGAGRLYDATVVAALAACLAAAPPAVRAVGARRVA
jgi:HD-GYP domain-containing protein (c-di-GMP phosphodiesterase class II)